MGEREEIDYTEAGPALVRHADGTVELARPYSKEELDVVLGEEDLPEDPATWEDYFDKIHPVS